MELHHAFEERIAAAPPEDHRAICREQFWFPTFERHPNSGGVIADRIVAYNNMNIPDLLELICHEDKCKQTKTI